jgi:putative transposase
MSQPFQPLRLLLVIFAGWVNCRQMDMIEYLQEQNRVLKERLGGRRIRFTDTERCRLARKAHTLGRKVLNELHTLVTPDTLLRWYREMVACKWNYNHRRGPGRHRVMQTIVNLVLRMALENRSWGYTRIQGAMANLGHEVGRATIANILREYGIDPAPERDKHMPWSTFLRAHRECPVATDFLTLEVCTIRGLVTHYVLFFIDIANRAVKIAGITPHPDNRWITQIARNLTDLNDGFLRGKRYLILDRDTKYSVAFRSVLVREGIHVIRLPPRSPNLNAFAERFVRSIKEECLSRMTFFGSASLQQTQWGSSWRTTTPSAIIRAWTTDFRGPHPSLPYPIILFNAASASAECSATTIGPQPDECRWIFWTIRRDLPLDAPQLGELAGPGRDRRSGRCKRWAAG